MGNTVGIGDLANAEHPERGRASAMNSSYSYLLMQSVITSRRWLALRRTNSQSSLEARRKTAMDIGETLRQLSATINVQG